METLLIILLVIYNISLVIWIIKDRKDTTAREKTSRPERTEEKQPLADIIGKSRYKPAQKESAEISSEPQASSEEEGEFITDISATFAGETDPQASGSMSEDEVEAAFEKIRISDIEQSYPEDEFDDVPEMRYASGATFEEIGMALESVDDPNLSDERRYKTGTIISALEGTMLLDELAQKNPKSAQKISELMEALDDVLISKIQDASVAYQDFDMRNYL